MFRNSRGCLVALLTLMILPTPFQSLNADSIVPVPRSCHHESQATPWCHCYYIEEGHLGSGSLPCSVLSCKDYARGETHTPCKPASPWVSCVFLNEAYAGSCVESSPPSTTNGQTFCEDILGCLKNPLCIKNYCNSTTIRTGWVLHQIIEHPKN